MGGWGGVGSSERGLEVMCEVGMGEEVMCEGEG